MGWRIRQQGVIPVYEIEDLKQSIVSEVEDGFALKHQLDEGKRKFKGECAIDVQPDQQASGV